MIDDNDYDDHDNIDCDYGNSSVSDYDEDDDDDHHQDDDDIDSNKSDDDDADDNDDDLNQF